MNTQILQKCISELQKETPDLSYIRGILETLVESTPVPNFDSYTANVYHQPLQKLPGTVSETIELTDEERDQAEFARKYIGGPVAPLG